MGTEGIIPRPQSSKWVLSRTGFTSFNLVKVAVGWKK